MRKSGRMPSSHQACARFPGKRYQVALGGFGQAETAVLMGLRGSMCMKAFG